MFCLLLMMMLFHFHVEYLVQLRCCCDFSLMDFLINEKCRLKKKLSEYIQVDQQSAAVVLTWNLSVFTIILVLFGLVVVWLTNLHSCLNISYMKDRRKGGESHTKTTKHGFFVFSSSLILLLSKGASSVPAFFSEDDSQSNDSSDSDSSSSQSDDVDQETFLLDEPLERTTSSSHANSAAQAPRSMQWAVRNTPSQRATGSTPSSSSTPAGQLSFFFVFLSCEMCIWSSRRLSQKLCVYVYLLWFLSFHSKLYWADIYWPDQPASLQCHQLQRRCSSSSTGG